MARTGNTSRKTPENKGESPDIAIVGGGIAGLTLAALLARAGVPALCLDRETPALRADGRHDGRALAINRGARLILEKAGLWDLIAPDACPIREIRIFDGDSPELLRFESAQANGQTPGWIVEIGRLRAALLAHASGLPALTHLAPVKVCGVGIEGGRRVAALEDGRRFPVRLIVGADGRESFVRKDSGLPARRWSYRQRAVVCAIEHENPHDNIAIEHFHPRGPFALLPMTDSASGAHRSTAVWVEEEDAAPSARDWSEKIFNAALAARVPEGYGKVKLCGTRFSYPLGLVHAQSYIGERLALVADAAHGIHPVAGQGINLGLQDVAALAELLISAHEKGADPGGPELLRAYQRARRFDNMVMAGSMDLLNRLFASDLAPVRAARRAGLGAVRSFPPLKRFLMKKLMGPS